MKIVCNVLFDVPNRLLHVLRRAESPRPNAIGHSHLPQLGAQVLLWVAERAWLQAEILVNLLQYVLGVVANGQDVVHVAQDVGVILQAVARPHHRFQPQVRIGSTRCVSQVPHAIRKMIPKGCAARLQSIQGSNYHSRLASVWSPLFAEYGINLLGNGRFDVGVLDVGHLDVQIIQRRNR